jgi:hypothetical protein
MNNELVLHPDGSNIIYITSFLQLIPLYFGLYYQVYDSSIITSITFFTSINYWRKPTKTCIRRYMDISCVLLGIYYHLYLIYYHSLSMKYYYMIGTGSLLYPLEYNIPKNNYYYVAICHSFLQIIACNICVCICHDINNKLISFK